MFLSRAVLVMVGIIHAQLSTMYDSLSKLYLISGEREEEEEEEEEGKKDFLEESSSFSILKSLGIVLG